MKKRITAILTLILMIANFSGVFAAGPVPTGSVTLNKDGTSAEISISSITDPVYAVQLELFYSGSSPSFTFQASDSNAYAVVKQNSNNHSVTVYLDNKSGLFIQNKKIILGTMTSTKSFNISTSANLILLDRASRPSAYENIRMNVSTTSTGGSGGSSGGGSSGGNGGSGGGSYPTLPPNITPPSTTSPALPTATPTFQPEGFTDIDGHWATESIHFVTEKGLFQGTSANTFEPDISMTRSMFVTVLRRFEGIFGKQWHLDTSDSPSFNDVPPDSWYADAVQWAAGSGVAKGTGEGTFSPDQAVTREQIAVMMINFTSLCNVSLPESAPEASFTDDTSISSWAKDAIYKAQKTGLLSGRPDGNFDPQAVATRAEVSAVIQRLAQQAAQQ